MTLPSKDELKRMFKRSWSSGGETPCGQGSTLAHTAVMRAELQKLLWKYGIRRVNDCGCGDFHWVKTLQMSGITYRGYDIIDRKRRNFPFEVKDVVTEALAPCDLVICKDVFIHWTNEMGMAALANFRKCATYLFAETTPGINNTKRMTAPGSFSPVNLVELPFNLGPPMEIIPDSQFRRIYGWWKIK